MAMLPSRRGSGRNLTLIDPTREFEDIYDRMGQLMNMAFAELGTSGLTDVPWTPLADVSETDGAYQVHIELPGIGRDWMDVQLVDGELIVTGEIIEEENGGGRPAARAVPAGSSTARSSPATSSRTK
jgi:HSP20 family protein